MCEVGPDLGVAVIPVAEGPRAMLRSVTLRGNEVVGERELLTEARLTRGEPFSYLGLEEGRLSAKLQHESIVEVHACNQDRDGNLCLAMELVPDCDLGALCKAQPHRRLDAGSPRETARLFALVGLGVARALAHAHAPDEYRERRP
ncbi:MAG: hypothetical protein IT378_26200, partial [Sandaracinaceae bacterium]|nr:hypothetical protein [Sandaracinaceae bacterium]